jgi:fumarate hydratase class II
LHSVALLTDSCTNFRQFAIQGVQADRERIADYVRSSLMVVTALTPHIGYDKAGEIAKHAHKHNSTLKDAAVQLGHVSADDFDRFVRPEEMTHPDQG